MKLGDATNTLDATKSTLEVEGHFLDAQSDFSCNKTNEGTDPMATHEKCKENATSCFFSSKKTNSTCESQREGVGGVASNKQCRKCTDIAVVYYVQDKIDAILQSFVTLRSSG